MGSDLLDDLNKASISELASSYLWPSTAFWVGNILVYSLLKNYSFDMTFLNSLSGEIITSVLSILAGGVVFTAWLMHLLVPFFYRFLQGVGLNFGLLRSEQVSHFLKLKKTEENLAIDYERWKNKQKYLMSTHSIDRDPYPGFKEFRNAVLDFIRQKISINLLSDENFYISLSIFSGLLERNREIWSSQDEFDDTKDKLAHYYQVALEEIEAQKNLLTSKRSKVASELLYRFPQEQDWILPSRFGNCWAAIESYTIVNYGVALPFLWPRLLAFIPKDYYEIIVRSKSRIDASVAGMLLLILFSAAWLYPVSRYYSPLISLFCILASIVVFWLTYRLSIDGIISYGKLIISAVDLYRHEVIRKMGLNLPSDILAEKIIWRDLQGLWTSSTIANLVFNKRDE